MTFSYRLFLKYFITAYLIFQKRNNISSPSEPSENGFFILLNLKATDKSDCVGRNI